jgi:hypothetical protein
VKHHLTKPSKPLKSKSFKQSRFSRANLTIFAVIFAAVGGYFIYSSFAASPTCDFNATNATTLNSAVSSATAGQTICLATGSYGTFSGTNKAITIIAASGATPSMQVSFGSGDANFTLDGMSGMGGTISGTATNITIKNSTFADEQDVSLSYTGDAKILFDHDHFPSFVGTVRLWVGLNSASGITVQNSLFDNPGGVKGNGSTAGGADGVKCDAGTINVINNEFSGINDRADDTGNHGDAIQINGGQCIVKGNYFHGMLNSASCSMGEWDGGNNNVFENNVVDTGGCYEAVSLYADKNSVIDHNTFITPASGCIISPQSECAGIAMGAKTGGSSSGDVVRDNVMGGIGNGNGGVNATYTENHNLCSENTCGGTGDIGGGAGDITSSSPNMVGGAHPNTHDGFLLAANPGKSAASDGTDIGAFAIGNITYGPVAGGVTPPPPPPPPPADTTPPTVSLTAPAAGATVSGSSVAVSASASDNVGVIGVQFKLDGANLNAEDTTSPYSITWNTAAATNGTHTLTAVARDAAGNTKTSSSVTVTVNNATSTKVGDLNNDGSVNIFDLSILLSKYNTSDATADINNDGIVNVFDLSILLSHYGT